MAETPPTMSELAEAFFSGQSASEVRAGRLRRRSRPLYRLGVLAGRAWARFDNLHRGAHNRLSDRWALMREGFCAGRDSWCR